VKPARCAAGHGTSQEFVSAHLCGVCGAGPSRGLAADAALLAAAGKGGEGGLQVIRNARALLAHARLRSMFRGRGLF
jgi:hypothetical protein